MTHFPKPFRSLLENEHRDRPQATHHLVARRAGSSAMVLRLGVILARGPQKREILLVSGPRKRMYCVIVNY